MIDDARKFEREVLHADVPQPAAEFVILAAPALDQFVVAVDANGVVAPEGHVAAARHFGLVAAEDRRCPGDADGVQPVGDILFPCVDVDRAVRQQSCRISGTQQHAAAADEASRTCDGDMVAHEIRMEDDIAVDLDDVGARGARRGIRCPPAIRGRSGWTSARGNVRSAVRCARPNRRRRPVSRRARPSAVNCFSGKVPMPPANCRSR